MTSSRISGDPSRRRAGSVAFWAAWPAWFVVLASIGLFLGYLEWAPLAPDLAAQVARANIVRAAGASSWWTGWFGGMSLPSYSVLAPSAMALLGVRTTGAIAVLVSVLAARVLARDTLRPRATVAACAITAAANLLNGRVTFAVGMAAGMTTLVAIRVSRRIVLTLTCAVLTYLASPLAGLFLGIVAIAIAAADSRRRRDCVAVSTALLIVAGLMTLFFPGVGTMPFGPMAALPAALCAAGVALMCRQPIIRVSAVLTLVAVGIFLLVPSAVGENITRLAWTSAIPAMIASAKVPRRALVASVALLACWPLTDLAGQLRTAGDPSTQASFYAPVIAQVAAQRHAAGADAIGARVEVVDTASHWASVYLSSLSIARGWDRQQDHADSPLFYDPGALTPASYRSWLDSLAVRWVAVPRARLDYAAVSENALIADGQPYLRKVWSDHNWQLYSVTNPALFASGATVTAVRDTSIRFNTRSAAMIHFRLRWSPYLTVLSLPTATAVSSCVVDAGGFVEVKVAAAGRYELVSHFQPARRLTTKDPGCFTDKRPA